METIIIHPRDIRELDMLKLMLKKWRLKLSFYVNQAKMKN
jgi:hypothetical protein